MEKLSQLFNNTEQSRLYNDRPEYNIEIVDEIIQFWRKYNTNLEKKKLDIVDVGCGTGQLTKLFIPYANSLIGTDSSETQINEAKCNLTVKDFPKYITASCDNIPADDASIDLVTAALCVHWFDIDKFYAEVDRCLRQYGVLAIITFGEGRFILEENNKNIDELNHFFTQVFWFHDDYLGPYFHEKGKFAWKLLPGIKLLYPETSIRNESLSIDFKVTLNRLGNYLRSTSTYQAWKKDNHNKRDVIEASLEKILGFLGNPESRLDTEVHINFAVSLIMCSKF